MTVKVTPFSAFSGVFDIAAEDRAHDDADLAFPLTAFALYDHHALALGRGDEAVSEIFLQSWDIVFMKKTGEETQPVFRLRRGWIVENRKTALHDLRLSLRKSAVQKQRAVCQMDSVGLRGQGGAVAVEFQKVHDVADGTKGKNDFKKKTRLT